MGRAFQFCKMKTVLEFGCTAVGMYLILLNCTLKKERNGKFYVIYVLPQFKEKSKKTKTKISYLLSSHGEEVTTNIYWVPSIISFNPHNHPGW